jgi:acyl-CoA synthetase (AMP-forming)/AMP-acid ligase II
MDLQRESLERQARWRPDDVAVREVESGRTRSYAELDSDANRFAHVLKEYGISQGDRVALALPNVIAVPIVVYGCHKIGAIPVVANYWWSAVDFEQAFERTDPDVVVYDVEVAEHIEQVIDDSSSGSGTARTLVMVGGNRDTDGPPELSDLLDDASSTPIDDPVDQPRNVSYIFFTSGTTGDAKAVAHSTKSGRERIMTALTTSRMGSHTVCLLLVPLFHGGGLDTSLRAAVATGAECLLLRNRDAESVVDAIEQFGVTDVRSVPTLTQQVLELTDVDNRDFDAIEHWRNTGAVLSESLASSFVERISPNLFNSYGSSEAGNHAYVGPEDFPERAGAAGRPTFGTDVRTITADTDRSVPPDETVEKGEAGEVIVRSEQLYTGYYNDGEATRERVRDGWYYTHDIGYVQDGVLVIEGRIDDMILSGGELVSAIEVEEVLESHPSVAEAIVVGTPDEEWGEVVTAYVDVREEEADLDAVEGELRAFCKESDALANYKTPRRYEFESSLPHTGTGKKNRESLR